ncbi:CIC11C00000004087 [Sungouiella intermedia]|uniref:DNA mismatch repair protein HSM3 n=1 Tax=Sungouiella intermedia TaxID=45354 RepID=A0A1L0D2U4_9ASCO|nr:CIC11C00000004087 [[Candida] intermedia]
MRDRAQLDAKSLAVLHHLESYVNGDEQADASIVSDYIRFIGMDHAVVAGPGDILSSAVLTSFVPLLSRILNCDLYADIYVQLLTAMLEQLSFGNVTKYFSEENVMEALNSSQYAVVYMAIHVVKVNLSREDVEVAKFLVKFPALQSLTKRLLDSVDVPTSIVSDTEECIRIFAGLEHFNIAGWEFIEDVHKSSAMNDASLLGRYLSVIQSLALKISSETARLLSDFDMTKILNEDPETADPFLASMLIAFYSFMLTKVPFYLIQKPVDQCVQDFAKRRQEDRFDFIVDPTLMDLLSRASLASNESQSYLKLEFERIPLLTKFDFSSPEDVRYFCKLDLSVIPRRAEFFDSTFTSWTFQNLSYAHFRCLIHLIDNEELFGMLVDSGKLEEKILIKLPHDLLYEFTERVTRYDYSATQLFRQPHLVLNQLIVADPAIVNSQIWELKKQALQNLLCYRNVDMGAWKQALMSCYKEMLNGRLVKSVEPKVDVTDEAM